MISDFFMHNFVLIIIGQTAVGKTQLSLDLARHLNGEIISADSRQIYRYMTIGTAKPTPDELRAAPHHFIDILDPDQDYSAGEFGTDARRVVAEIQQRGHIPMVIGGAGFYIRALVDGLNSPPISDPVVKRQLKERLGAEGLDVLRQELIGIDPVAAQKIHPNDAQRTLRALEVFILTGKPFSQYRTRPGIPGDFTPYFVGLTRERQQLYQIIEQRVDMMLAVGLLDEVRDLQKRGFGPELNSLQTVGYQEVFQHFAGEIDYDEMVLQIKRNTRHYAKRQETWFKSETRIHWHNLDNAVAGNLLAENLVAEFGQ